MTNFESYLLPPDEPLDPELWGPEPTSAEIEQVEARNNEKQRERIKQVTDELLPSCVDISNLARHGINLDIDRSREAVRAGHLIGFHLNTTEGTLWYPRWQFVEQDDGTYERNETLLGLWQKMQCVQGINFCYFVKQHSGAESFEQIPERLKDPAVVQAVEVEIERELHRGH